MNALKVVALGILALVGIMLPSCSRKAQPATEHSNESPAVGYVLQPADGEVLLLRRPGGGQVVIKVDPLRTGSRRVAMGSQKLPVHSRIPVHRHELQEEILFVHEGQGTAIVGEIRVPVEPGSTIYIPEGVWHGVENAGDAPAEIIWVIAPPGLERFFRDIGAPSGDTRRPLTDEEMIELNRKHGITVKIE